MSKGKNSDEPFDIVLLDVKTGNAGPSPIQKRIEAATAGKRISFDVLRISDQTGSEINTAESGTQQLGLTVQPANSVPLSDTRRDN